MTYSADLTPCNYPFFRGEASEKLLSVGWLYPSHDYSRGPLDQAFVAKLFDLLRHPWQPAAFGGGHDCEFCRYSWGHHSFRLAGQNDSASIGINNLFVPGDNCLFVAPSLIIHYIDAHEYCPPRAFQQAVLACPDMESMEYLRAILANGPQGIASLLGQMP